MCCEIDWKTWITIIPSVIAICTIYISNKNAKRTILVSKYEEMASLLFSLSLWYSKLYRLSLEADDFQAKTHPTIKSLVDYNKFRDLFIQEDEKSQIQKDNIRFATLNEFYCKGVVFEKMNDYANTILACNEYALSLKNEYKLINFPKGFPHPDEFDDQRIILHDLLKDRMDF